MEEKKNFWDLSKAETEELLAQSAAEEIAKTHAAGRPTTHGDKKGVYQLFPNGRREYVKIYRGEKLV